MEKANIKPTVEEGQIDLFTNETPEEAKLRARKELAERLARIELRQPRNHKSKPLIDLKKAQAGEHVRRDEEE